MSTKKYDDLSKLNDARSDWKIKVRVIRIWRGTTMTGEIFKSFNVLMIDKKVTLTFIQLCMFQGFSLQDKVSRMLPKSPSQETKIHAFVPAKSAHDIGLKLSVGRIYSITNFDVETYKPEEKFRCVQLPYHIILKEYTKVKDVEDDGSTFPEDAFDFYDHSELLQIANKNVYLTGMISYFNVLLFLTSVTSSYTYESSSRCYWDHKKQRINQTD